LAQIHSSRPDRPVRSGSDLDLQDAIGQKYPGVVRISLLIGVLAVSWSGVFATALVGYRFLRHLTH
jgi:hypothetical protein